MGRRLFTEGRRAAFVAALAEHGHVGRAAQEAETPTSTIYLTRRNDPAFEARVLEALAVAAARLVEAEEQSALDAAESGSFEPGGGGSLLGKNPWLRARLVKKADGLRRATWSGGAPRSRDELERSVAGKLDLLARRITRGQGGA